MTRWNLVAAISMAWLCGCGSTSTPSAPNEVNGTVAGQVMDAKDAISTSLVLSGSNFTGNSLAMLLTDYSGACANEAADAGVKNGKALFFALVSTDATGAASPAAVTASYSIISGSPAAHAPNAHLAEVSYQGNNVNCLPDIKEFSDSGMVTVTAVSASGIRGTFDVHFQNGDHLTGAFDATNCVAFNPNRTPLATCQ